MLHLRLVYLFTCGVILCICAVFAEIAWLIFCFGSIIIGLLLLIFSPMILLFPLLSLSGLGLAFLNSGVEQAKEL
ncbi:TPA: hypothetical protein JIY90_15005 [Acinetobacter baumannii]|nr:hypothetical protein [Acinetobacter baumannii]